MNTRSSAVMRAIIFDAPAPDTTDTRVGELPIPEPGPGAVSIRVTHAGVNFKDIMARRGDPGYVPDWPFVPGLEVAGFIDAVGAGVNDLSVGDSVVAYVREMRTQLVAAASSPKRSRRRQEPKIGTWGHRGRRSAGGASCRCGRALFASRGDSIEVRESRVGPLAEPLTPMPRPMRKVRHWRTRPRSSRRELRRMAERGIGLSPHHRAGRALAGSPRTAGRSCPPWRATPNRDPADLVAGPYVDPLQDGRAVWSRSAAGVADRAKADRRSSVPQ